MDFCLGELHSLTAGYEGVSARFGPTVRDFILGNPLLFPYGTAYREGLAIFLAKSGEDVQGSVLALYRVINPFLRLF